MAKCAVTRRTVLLSTLVVAIGRGQNLVVARQATPTADTGEVLLEATFSPDELPAAAEGVFYRVTLPPGETLAYLAGPFCGCGNVQVAPGVGAELVQSGSYAVRLDAPFRVRRANGVTEDIAADTEVVLEAGDAGIFPDYAAPGEMRAASEDPAVVIGIAIVASAGSGTPAPDIPLAIEAEQLTTLTERGWDDIATGAPVAMSLQRIEVPAGGALGPYESAGAEAMLVEEGEIGSSILPPGATTPPGTLSCLRKVASFRS
jgi:hypothetical protein